MKTEKDTVVNDSVSKNLTQEVEEWNAEDRDVFLEMGK